MSFGVSINTAIVNMNNEMEKIVRGTLLDISKGVIMMTPVDEGTLRANWRASIGSPQLGVLDQQDETGEPTTNAANSQLQNMLIGQDYFLSNSMPYAYAIEFGGRSKIKAPQGMVRVTLARLSSIMGSQ